MALHDLCGMLFMVSQDGELRMKVCRKGNFNVAEHSKVFVAPIACQDGAPPGIVAKVNVTDIAESLPTTGADRVAGI
jgi:hypothetical protein